MLSADVGAIVGGVIGGLIGVVLLILLVLLVLLLVYCFVIKPRQGINQLHNQQTHCSRPVKSGLVGVPHFH